MENYSVWTFMCENQEITLLLVPNYQTAVTGQISYRPEKLNFKNMISYFHTNPNKNLAI